MDLNLNYTVMGSGGLSKANPPVSNHPFWWADTTSQLLAIPDLITRWGYQPLQQRNPPVPLGPSKGSILLSDPFTANVNQTLEISALIGTKFKDPSFDFGFAVLLKGGALNAALFTVGITNNYGTTPPTLAYTANAATVNTTRLANPNATMDDVVYGAPQGPQDCQGNCGISISASYNPAAGQYQLLFGCLGQYITGPPIHADGIVVKSVDLHP